MKWTLPIIVISQFLCTSLWFAGNAVLPELVRSLGTSGDFLASLTSAVQLGFVAGTLSFAALAISDRFSPSSVFCCCSIIAAAANLGTSIDGLEPATVLVLRMLTGVFLAGIYPVGMKIASDHYEQGLGRSLGLLVGALVVGTAFPHLLRSLTVTLPWKAVIYASSTLAVVGGLALRAFVPDGPYRKAGQGLRLDAFRTMWRSKPFRATALGYFGHMWELYTFWAFVPAILAANASHHGTSNSNSPILTFLVIAPGGLACVVTGMLSARLGAKPLATACLTLSGLCCLLSPFFLYSRPAVLMPFLLFWGLVVVADSPMFSTLVARHAPADRRGSALTLVNCIGFTITILSIEAFSAMSGALELRYRFLLLAPGPILGIVSLLRAGSR